MERAISAASTMVGGERQTSGRFHRNASNTRCGPVCTFSASCQRARANANHERRHLDAPLEASTSSSSCHPRMLGREARSDSACVIRGLRAHSGGALIETVQRRSSSASMATATHTLLARRQAL
eukprot:6069659-Prymnesium_polylepis.3